MSTMGVGKYPLLRAMAEGAFARHELKGPATAALSRELSRIQPWTDEFTELCAYAAATLSGDYIRNHRHEPLDEDVRVRETDTRFTPRRKTASEILRHNERMAKTLFEFRMNDNSSIWSATREKIDEDLAIRQPQAVGCLREVKFLEKVRDRLQPGETPQSAGLSHKDMFRMRKDAESWAVKLGRPKKAKSSVA